MGFEQDPGTGIGRRPVFAEDALANGALIAEFAKAFLDSDADVSAFAGRTVAVNKFEDEVFLFAGRVKFPIEMCQSLVDERHASFEIDHGNGDR